LLTEIDTDIMGLADNAHPSSVKCELIVSAGPVSVIANALIGQSFFGRIKLIPVVADNHGTFS
jgi:hypothetical protein